MGVLMVALTPIGVVGMVLCYFGFASAVLNRKASLGYLFLMFLAAIPCVGCAMYTEAVSILEASAVAGHRSLVFLVSLPTLVGAVGFLCGIFHFPSVNVGWNVYVGDEVRIFIVHGTFIALAVLGGIGLVLIIA